MKAVLKFSSFFCIAFVLVLAFGFEKSSAASNYLPFNSWKSEFIQTVEGVTYTIHLEKDGVVTLEMKNSQDAKWDMVLSNKNNKELLGITSTTYLLSGKTTKREVGLPKGDYIVQVKGNWGNFDSIASLFRVNVQYRTDYEKEDNTLLQSATPISLNKTYYGNINDNNDRDSFKFKLAADSRIKLNLSNYKNVIWEAVIYDANEREYQRLKSIDSPSGQVSAEVGLSKGTYYVVIRQQDSYKYDNERYHFEVYTNTKQNVEQESNDTMGSATKIGLGTSYEGIISSTSDYDFYRVEIPTNNIYTSFSISNRISSQWVGDIYNEVGGLIKSSLYTNSRKNGYTTYNTYLPKGSYYIRVSSNNMNTVNKKYTVKVLTKTVSKPIKSKNVTVKNPKGAKDTVTVKSVSKNDMIRVYDNKGKLLKKATANRESITITKLNLGSKAGVIQVSIERPGQIESNKTKIKFSKEK
ncbi:hypothetical protein H5P36_18995 [Bacillus sp. APMAM]|nr:hypothetical protein [Bacillus sp. APMAM]RTZ54366.1 hypothetical protein EKO25_18460 [Bacillus sp. SAJ1]